MTSEINFVLPSHTKFSVILSGDSLVILADFFFLKDRRKSQVKIYVKSIFHLSFKLINLDSMIIS